MGIKPRATDATVTPQDVLGAMLHIRKEGMSKIAAGILQREPALGDLITGRWQKVQDILHDLGLSEEQARPILIEMSRLMVESVTAMERSYQRMWADFLPDPGDSDEG